MERFKVTKVRKAAPPANPAHQHIIGVVTEDGVYHTNQEVVDSLAAGNAWVTSVPGEAEASIAVEPYCPKPWCMHGPYLASDYGSELANDLEKLPLG